jgi:predicted DNA-binding transcriptional regulator AlpA
MKPRPIPTDPDALLTEDEAAALLGVSARTLQSWRTLEKGPPPTKLGRAVRYARGLLIAWHRSKTKDGG